MTTHTPQPASTDSRRSGQLRDSMLRWFATGQRGLSSEAMASCAIDAPVRDWPSNHPHDPADFNRCLLLVAQVPHVREAFPAIAKLSPQWRTIIEHWDELEAMFVGEAGLNWEKAGQAPNTFARMRDLLMRAAGETP